MWFGKMFPDSFPRTEDEISSGSSVRWGSAVISDAHGYWTHGFSALPQRADGYSACSLADVLEPSVPPKYSLSALACRGILRRAAKRGSVANALAERPDRDGGNSEGQRLTVGPLTRRIGDVCGTEGVDGNFFIAHSLTAAGFDASEDGTGRGTPLVARE